MAREPLLRGSESAPNNYSLPNDSWWAAAGKLNSMTEELYSLSPDTINAGFSEFDAATVEASIALADAACVAQGKTILYIPLDMLPYDITLCPPSAGVQRVREGGDYSVYDVLAYGAGLPAGDDAICINYALAAAPRGTPVRCPVTVAGYTISTQIVVPTGGFLQGYFRGPGYTRWAETTGLSLGVTPGSTFFKITDTSLIPVVLRTNSRVEGIVFWYPNQLWNITSLAQSFTTYQPTIQLGDATLPEASHPVVWDCHFLGATTCIKQYLADGSTITSPEIGRCSGVLLGDFLRLYRATDITRVFQCHFNPNAATNYVGDASVGGNTAVFRTKAAQAATVFHIGNIDGLEVSQVFAYGAKYYAWYEDDFYTGDANEGAAGSFTNCAGDGVYQAFRIERSNNVFPLLVANSWYAPLFRPNGVAGDSANQALLSFKTSLTQLRVHLVNVTTHGAAVGEFSTNYSGAADYAMQADGALGATSLVFASSLSCRNLNTGIVPSALVPNVVFDLLSTSDVLQRRVRQAWVQLTYSASIATDSAIAECFQISVTDTNAFSILAPTNGVSGDTVTYMIHNGSGGAMGAITWQASGGASFSMGAFTNPANGFVRMITFVRRGSDWRELSRTTSDAVA